MLRALKVNSIFLLLFVMWHHIRRS